MQKQVTVHDDNSDDIQWTKHLATIETTIHVQTLFELSQIKPTWQDLKRQSENAENAISWLKFTFPLQNMVSALNYNTKYFLTVRTLTYKIHVFSILPESPLMSLDFRSRAFMMTIVMVSAAGW